MSFTDLSQVWRQASRSMTPRSKYSTAATRFACRRTASTRDRVCSSEGMKQVRPQIFSGRGSKASSSWLMTPRVPSEPMMRSMASMSSFT